MDVGLENVSMPNLVNEHKLPSQSQRYFVLKSAPSYFVSESAAIYVFCSKIDCCHSTIFEFQTNFTFSNFSNVIYKKVAQASKLLIFYCIQG